LCLEASYSLGDEKFIPSVGEGSLRVYPEPEEGPVQFEKNL
jgi:hypothetical protein